jgi:ABC-type multidrug transport system ATPase subunit
MLKKIQQEGITTVVSTPYMDEAELCDRVALIQKGSLMAVADPSALAEGGEKLLYSLRSSKGVYAYLDKVRELEGCRHAWLFGDELHVTLRSADDTAGVRKVLDSCHDESLLWQSIVPSIEDRFMGLLQQESDSQSAREEGR